LRQRLIAKQSGKHPLTVKQKSPGLFPPAQSTGNDAVDSFRKPARRRGSGQFGSCHVAGNRL